MLVLTAPTGNIGRRVVETVCDTGAQVRVVARDPGKLADPVRDRVEVVAGSHGDAAVIDRALDGADTLFWLCPSNPRATSAFKSYVDFARPAAEAIRRHGVERVVIISALGRGTAQIDHAGLVSASVAAAAMLSATGAATRSLALAGFMDNSQRDVATITAQGTVFGIVPGERKLPLVAVRDIAATASRLLLDTSWTGTQDVPLLGPEDLSANEMAATMTDVLGTPVRYEQVAAGAVEEQLTGHGFTAAMARALTDMMAAKADGLDDGTTRTAQHALDTPTSFREWCERELKPAFDAA